MSFKDIDNVPLSRNFLCEVSLGKVAGWSRTIFKGFLPNASSLPAYIWTGGSFTWRNTPTAAEILSSSASDTAAGTGARTILITGIGPNFALTSETAILNGVSPVTLTHSYIHINRISIVTVGSGQVNAGAITARVISGGATLAHMAASVGSSQSSLIMTAANQVFLAFNQVLGTNGAAAQITTFGQEFYNTTTTAIIRDNVFHISTNGSSPFVLPQEIPLIVPAKTGFAWRTTAQSAGTPDLTARVQGLLVDTDLGY